MSENPMVKLAGIATGCFLLLILITSTGQSESPSRDGCLGTANSKVPDTTGMYGLPYDFRLRPDGSIVVVYSTGDSDGAVRLCTLDEGTVRGCTDLTNIRGPRLVPFGQSEGVAGLGVPSNQTGSSERDQVVVMALPEESTAATQSESFRKNTDKLGMGPIDVFNVTGSGTYIAQGSKVVKLDQQGKEASNYALQSGDQARILRPQLLATTQEAVVVVAESRSQKGTRIVSGTLEPGVLKGIVSDRDAWRVGDFQALSNGGAIYCFWVEIAGRNRRLMMDVSNDGGKTWGNDRLLLEENHEVRFDARPDHSGILLAWLTGRRFDQPSHQSLNVAEVNSEGFNKKQTIQDCTTDCAILDFSLGSTPTGGWLLTASMLKSGRPRVVAYTAGQESKDIVTIFEREMPEAGKIDCLRVTGREHRFVLMYRFERAIRSFIQPFIPGQLCYSIIDVKGSGDGQTTNTGAPSTPPR